MVKRFVAVRCIDTANDALQMLARWSLLVAMMVREAINLADEATLAKGLRFERRVIHSLFSREDQKEGMAASADKRKIDLKHR